MVAKQVIAGVVAAVLSGCVWPETALAQHAREQAPAAQEYALDIPRLPIIEALKEFTTQTGLLISFWPDAQTDQARLVGPLRGKFTAEIALTRLLAESGLTYRRTNERSLVVMAPSLLGAPRNGVSGSDQDRSRLAEGQPYLRKQQRPPEESLTVIGRAGSNAIIGKPEVERVDEVIVIGSRIDRNGEGPAPVQVFTRRMIDDLGAASIPDVLRYVPQQPFTRAQHYYTNGAEYSQMRGVGGDTTLILINGRRVVPTTNSLALNAFDLNSIPLAAVERIEVLSDSASAIYGADAMGGVINLMLKKDIPQPVLDVQYGGANGGADLLRASFSAGYRTERLRSSVIFDYYQRDFLLGAERELWRNQDYTRYGGLDFRSPAGVPGTVSSLDGDNLPGLSSSFAMVPVGSSGIGLTPQDFVATAGLRNRTGTLSTLSIVPKAERRSVAVFGEFDLAQDLMAFAEVLYTNRRVISQEGFYPVQGALVPADNPFNPFQQPVRVDFILDGLEPGRFEHDMDWIRGAFGLRGGLNSRWQWEVAAIASTEADDALSTVDLSAARLDAALAERDPARALNPFVDGPAGSGELLASLIAPERSRHVSRGRQLSAFVQGELFELPTGAVQAVVGGEWRDEEMVYDDRTLPVNNGRDVRAAFTELRAPLIGPTASGRGDVLAMTLAARVDDYSDFGSTLNPQFGLLWRPAEGVLLRGSYGTSFRPPSIFELHAPRTTVTNAAVRDPARNNGLSTVTFVAGGNPDLRPIEADSMTTGFVITPSAAPGLRLLANYWRIHTEHRVTFLHFTSLLANEEAFHDRILRDTPTQADIDAGMPGRLLQLDISRMNFGRLSTSGIDVEAKYELSTRWGDFTPSVSATWIDEFTSVEAPGVPAVDRVGIANPAGSIPRWRVVGSLGWKRPGLGLSTTVDWLPGYMDADSAGLTGRRLPSRTVVDVQASFAMDELIGTNLLWDDLTLQLGVKNVFDELAPFSEIGFSTGFDSSQGDLIGRFSYLRLSKGF
ncbi:TonB system transporter [Steroidobacter agaridevorans]|uniref:TonB system transporter n=1 Tax=Steroidobacter agaridevorans TaxID=2695856 RepID=A0A829YMW6_9GAMM|nr:TonB-dependent receptor [Steroidobacter agaridevorans]GFE84590.1 TonB system transporter [Steroidobacter agaridevorans]GFE90991.1 TonB system transporter [Steroidobacter agaridevorans]